MDFAAGCPASAECIATVARFADHTATVASVKYMTICRLSCNQVIHKLCNTFYSLCRFCVCVCVPFQCRDVRTREVGIQEIHHKVKPYEVEIVRRDYVANGGWETFLAYEDPKQGIMNIHQTCCCFVFVCM